MSEDDSPPLKMTVKIEGCPYQDMDDIKTFMNARELKSALWEVDQKIRARLKYTEDVSEKEEAFLEEVRSLIWEENLLEGS